jgi:c-di-GMP-binding flagellar brake protein YcgR
VSNPLSENGPQPPRVLTAPLEIFANLRLLQQHRDPLTIRFANRNQRFQSFLVALDRDRNVLALDELVPSEGERLIRQGEAYEVEGYRDGVRMAWECDHEMTIGELDGAPCYWGWLPEALAYHQRRGAFRVSLKETEPVDAELRDSKLKQPLGASLLDISATGCKLQFAGDVSANLRNGQTYDQLLLKLPFGSLELAVEVRHQHYDEKLECSQVGVRFYEASGLAQRQIERFVYQLQREARRTDD